MVKIPAASHVTIRPSKFDEHIFEWRGRRRTVRRHFFQTVQDVQRELVDLDGHGDPEMFVVITFNEGGELYVPAPEGTAIWVEPERH